MMVDIDAMLHLLDKYIPSIPLRLTDKKDVCSRCHGCLLLNSYVGTSLGAGPMLNDYHTLSHLTLTAFICKNSNNVRG